MGIFQGRSKGSGVWVVIADDADLTGHGKPERASEGTTVATVGYYIRRAVRTTGTHFTA